MPSTNANFSVTLIGLGNIGSFVVPLLAKVPGLRRVVLVDRDIYEARNLDTQRISRRDLCQPKAVAQTRALRALNLDIATELHHADVRNVPPGRLRADVILSAVDSLEARLLVNQVAFGLGVPWLDAGVAPAEQLARVSGFLPGPEAPCYECALGDRDYHALGASTPCERARVVSPTNAPAQLGALAAALLVAEAAKVLAGRCDASLLGRQLVLGTESWPHFVSKLVRNPQCRFNHRTWRLAPRVGLSPRSTLAEAFSAVAAVGGTSLRVPGKSFARALRCPKCGATRAGLHVLGSAAVLGRNCARCGRERIAAMQDLVPQLDAKAQEGDCNLRLADLGLRAGDVLEVTGGADAFCLELHAADDENRCEEGEFSSSSRRVSPVPIALPAESERGSPNLP